MYYSLEIWKFGQSGHWLALCYGRDKTGRCGGLMIEAGIAAAQSHYFSEYKMPPAEDLANLII